MEISRTNTKCNGNIIALILLNNFLNLKLNFVVQNIFITFAIYKQLTQTRCLQKSK